MKTYYAYTRVSTLKQGDGASLEAQKEAISNYAEKNGLTIAAWFEEMETAAKATRPIFNEMVGQLKRGRANGLIVHKIDRSARNFKDWAKVGDLAEAGCDIHFAYESIDFNSRGGRLAADIQALVAADYIRNLRDESIKGQQMRLRQGLFPYMAPLGYLDNGQGKLKTICKLRGPLVRKMFELYASGNHSIRSLTDEMYRIGLTTKGGRKVAKTSIEQMLKNPFYAGLIKVRRSGQVYSGAHEPLISMELFEAVTNQRQGGRIVQKQTKHNHTYRGLWRCGLCCAAMSPERQKGHVYYRCHNRECETKSVSESTIEAAMIDMLQKCCLTDEQVSQLEFRVQEFLDSKDDLQMEQAIKGELGKLDTRMAKLTEKFVDDLISPEVFRLTEENIVKQRTLLAERLDSTAKNTVSQQAVTEFLERAKTLYLSYVFADADEKREIVKYTTSNRSVRGKDVEVEPQNWLKNLNILEASCVVDIIRSQINSGA